MREVPIQKTANESLVALTLVPSGDALTAWPVRESSRTGEAFYRVSLETTESSSSIHSQAYFWTDSWQHGEREADRDIQSGRTETFSDLTSAFSWLDDKN